MANKPNPTTDPRQPMVYQIRIQGHLGSEWTDWFEGLSITLEDNGETLLTGSVVDQAALYGLLRKVRDLGLPLLAVNRAYPGQADAADVTQCIEASCGERRSAFDTVLASFSPRNRMGDHTCMQVQCNRTRHYRKQSNRQK